MDDVDQHLTCALYQNLNYKKKRGNKNLLCIKFTSHAALEFTVNTHTNLDAFNVQSTAIAKNFGYSIEILLINIKLLYI